MKCPYCGEIDSKVIDSRPTEDGEKIRRRRECLSCKKRFTTYEIVETVPLMVVKRDHSREVFDRQKLLNGMLRACEKRPVSYDQLERAVSGYFDFIEDLIERENTFTMEEFAASVNEFLSFRRYTILKDKGSVSRREAEAKAHTEYDAFNKTQKIVSDFDREVERLLQKDPNP